MSDPSHDPMPAPLFSVVIPTRDRPATLPHAAATVLAQDFRDFELLVVDNASDTPASQVLAGQRNPHLRIVAAPQRLPMHRNWELGLSAARGRYVIFIGDDDALMPDGLRLAAELLRGTQADLLCWPPHDYKWPDAAAAAGQLTIRFGFMAGSLDLTEHLAGMYGFSGPEAYLTSVYHGAVSADLIGRIRQRQEGVYFSDPVCDIESEILNAYYARSALICQRPISMNGHSGGSNGGANGRLETLSSAYARFAAEAGLEPRDLTPCRVELPLYHGSVVAGCQQRVRERHFPHEERFRHDPERLLRWLIASCGVFGAERPPGLPEGFRALAQALHLEPGPIGMPPARAPGRQPTGLSTAASGQQQLVVEAAEAGIRDIGAAVRLAQAMLPPFQKLAGG